MATSRPAHAKKTQVVNEIVSKIKNCKGMVIAEYKNLSVAQITDLRNLALEENVFIKVYKDSLFTRAMEELKINGLDAFLTQQNIFLFSEEDPIKPAKLVAKFSKKNPDLKLKAGIYEGNVMDTAAITEIAMLPSKEELYSMFASSLIYPLRQFMLTVKEIANTKKD
ncbi:50S ribosomal protein L10 [Spiroplasma turonicum]|uniref:Large ribosomal subunit protein uL10 n=1 Tax=Spiroplasma turonicum TaxID=216946 RepID=A0A0K1P545_9MOLU|nr:50S ribosomal protein L10 [Spiroplasma turonicum]AKU79284.1 50S ribosomal protein L10 [Spiroplasma turonicum]ALX70307.1 50S ribosomal protein L10 [Spiroplasma turonicum]